MMLTGGRRCCHVLLVVGILSLLLGEVDNTKITLSQVAVKAVKEACKSPGDRCVGCAETLLALETVSKSSIAAEEVAMALTHLVEEYEEQGQHALAFAASKELINLSPESAVAKECLERNIKAADEDAKTREDLYNCPLSQLCRENVALQRSKQWLMDNGAMFKVHLFNTGDPSAPQVFANEDLEKGEKFAEIPDDLKILHDMDRYGKSSDAARTMLKKEFVGEHAAGEYAMSQLLLTINFLKASADPFYEPYVKTLPAVVNIPATWRKEQLALLNKTAPALHLSIKKVRKQMKDIWRKVRPSLREDWRGLNLDTTVLTEKKWIWAYQYVHSRVVQTGDPTNWELAPGLDKLLHRFDGAPYEFGGPLRAPVPIQSGEPLFTRYIREDDQADEAVLKYGIVPTAAVSFSLPFPVDDKLDIVMGQVADLRPNNTRDWLDYPRVQVGRDVRPLLRAWRLHHQHPLVNINRRWLAVWEPGEPMPWYWTRNAATEEHAVRDAIALLEATAASLRTDGPAPATAGLAMAADLTGRLRDQQLRLVDEALGELRSMAEPMDQHRRMRTAANAAPVEGQSSDGVLDNMAEALRFHVLNEEVCPNDKFANLSQTELLLHLDLKVPLLPSAVPLLPCAVPLPPPDPPN